jgi:hypothetical protein
MERSNDTLDLKLQVLEFNEVIYSNHHCILICRFNGLWPSTFDLFE